MFVAASKPAKSPVAVGVDGARGGWVAALAYRAGGGDQTGQASVRWQTRLALFADINALADAVSDSGAAVAIDVPIGLLDSFAYRPCDVAARKLLKARASTVFAPPARYMLPAAGYYAA